MNAQRMVVHPHRTCALVLIALVLFQFTQGARGQAIWTHPVAGEVYKEFSRVMVKYSDWRVTDPDATAAGAIANLPNAVLRITIDDLAGATRAEAVIDLWEGHAGTYGKKIRFNSNSWIPIPELTNTPTDPECYHGQVNVTVPIPLNHLVQGTNTFEGTNDGQTCFDFGWGQHGMNGIIIRVYYDGSRSHATGQIVSPVTGTAFADNPEVQVTASGGAGVARVDLIGYFEGYDTDGDGIYGDWQYNYHRAKTDTLMRIYNHVGTRTTAPYDFTWNTEWVPDQAAGSIKLMARICDNNGVWYVTDEVAGLTLQRNGSSVRLYTSTGVPERFSVRAGRTPRSSSFTIPSGTNLADVTAARMVLSTYNGYDAGAAAGEDHYYRINTYYVPGTWGADHFYSLDSISIPQSAFKTGTNSFTINSESALTGIWVNWPGPAFLLRFTGEYASPLPSSTLLAGPPDGSSGIQRPVIFRWLPSVAAATYRLQVALDSLFAATVVDDSMLTDTLFQADGLAASTTYFWRVRAENAGGTGAWSSTWSLGTGAAAPLLVSPADSVSGLPVSLELVWMTYAGASGYHLQAGTDAGFLTGLVHNDSTLTDTTAQLSNLVGGTRYFWRVAARIGAVSGAFSSARTFTTTLNAPPAVALHAPSDHEAVNADSVVLRWHPGQPPVSFYSVEVGFDSLFSIRTADSTITDTFKVVRAPLVSHSYSWRVRARNAAGWGVYSEVRQFRQLVSGADDALPLPENFELLQNYPNPFNPSTRIEYAVPSGGHAVLEIVNLLGERVATLLDGYVQPGRHTVGFDAAGLSSGCYFYRLSAGGQVMIRRMTLLR